jgi:endonuclease G
MKKYILLLIIIISSCNPNQEEKQNNNSKISIKKDTFNFLPKSKNKQIIHHQFYSLSYKEEYENAEWVAYSLVPKQISKAQRERPYFIRDPKVKTKSAHYKNYYPNGYEKGHLLPAADMRFSLDAFDDTFYTSNVSPMDHYFNAGIWNDLEKQVRYWTKRYGKLYIITGGVLKPDLERIGREDVAVPDEFYKIILDYKNAKNIKIIAFLIPHKNLKPGLKKYVVTVDSIEKLTGIDFFSALPDSLENELEANKYTNKWKFVHFKRY